MNKPDIKPHSINFSSGPCAKRPGWNAQEALGAAYLGRSHRASGPKARLKEVIDLHREILGIPADYRIGIVPASDSGAVEMALWSLLGPRGVDVFAWESFGKDWYEDVKAQLKLDVRGFIGDFGELPDLAQADFERDVVFTWNGTTSGVCVPDANWIRDDRAGLTICDATSAVFAFEMNWEKLDVTTWSWQKALGGEAAHGMIVLSPRAVERLESYVPSWPIPKIFRMTNKGKLIEGIFEGVTINTPSMMAVEDCMDALRWVKAKGGVGACMADSKRSLEAVSRWVAGSDWVEFLAADEAVRSYTSICLRIKDEWFLALEASQQEAFLKSFLKLMEQEGVAYDINAYRDAPAGLRIWAGPTVVYEDVCALLPWLDWGYGQLKAQMGAKPLVG